MRVVTATRDFHSDPCMLMQHRIFRLFYNVICFLTISFQSASTAAEPPADLDAVRKELLEMRQGMQEMQTRHQQEIDVLKKQVADQQAVIDGLRPAAAAPPGGEAMPPPAVPESPATEAAVLPPAPGPDELGKGGLPVGPEAGGPMFPTTDPSLVAGTPDAPPGGNLLPAAPLTGGGGSSAPRGTYLDISFDAILTGAASSARDLDLLEVGDHDPQQRGFNGRNFELALNGAVDPWFEGFANIVFKLDNNQNTEAEVEEAYGQTTTLPGGLQVKAGQFFSPFGRINPTHPHTWDFVDAPLVEGRMLGGDGLRGLGAQVSWVMPLPFYAQAMVALQNGQGGTAFSFRNPGDSGTFFGRTTVDQGTNSLSRMVVTPRLEASFDLTPTRTVLAGVSAAFGHNDTGFDCTTQIYGADLSYKWKPANAEGGWPFFKWQSEAMFRKYQAGRGLNDSFPAAETFDDWGAYSQVVWGFHKGWTAGLRGDYLQMEDSLLTKDPLRQSRWRVSSDLTWYPSEFSKLRLQYNHDLLQADNFFPCRAEDSVFFMYEISLGAHGAHKY